MLGILLQMKLAALPPGHSRKDALTSCLQPFMDIGNK
jgi:hypothetical protein